jgi:hypothetical protein
LGIQLFLDGINVINNFVVPLDDALVVLVPNDDVNDLVARSNIFSQLVIHVLNRQIYIHQQQHLADLKMVTFSCQVKARTSDGVLVIQIGPFVLQKDVNDSRVAVPASYF